MAKDHEEEHGPEGPHETEKQQTAVYKEVTDHDKWYNRQLFKSVEILQTVNEFAAKQKPGQSQDLSATSDLIELLTQHEEAIPSTSSKRWTGTATSKRGPMASWTTRTTSSTLRTTSGSPFTYLT